MPILDGPRFTQIAGTVEEHLARAEARLPSAPARLDRESDRCDAVILHLFLAVQLVCDLALAACVRLRLGTPESYRDAIHSLARNGTIASDLGDRLVRATAFRDAIARAEELEIERIEEAARVIRDDARAFVRAVRGP